MLFFREREFKDMFSSKELAGSTLTLVDLNEESLERMYQLALQALLVDPVVNSITAAEKILEELWEINKPYIRPSV